jgi:hypothetical protein
MSTVFENPRKIQALYSLSGFFAGVGISLLLISENELVDVIGAGFLLYGLLVIGSDQLAVLFLGEDDDGSVDLPSTGD